MLARPTASEAKQPERLCCEKLTNYRYVLLYLNTHSAPVIACSTAAAPIENANICKRTLNYDP